MAGGDKSSRWWNMKRAKDRKIKRKTKQAASNKKDKAPGTESSQKAGGEISATTSETKNLNDSVSQVAPNIEPKNKKGPKGAMSSDLNRNIAAAASSKNVPINVAPVKGVTTSNAKSDGVTQAKMEQGESQVSSTLSKQARKRRQKRLREKQNRESEKIGNVKSGGTQAKLGKDKGSERTDIPPKKKPKRFNDKQNSAKSTSSKTEVSPPVTKVGEKGLKNSVQVVEKEKRQGMTDVSQVLKKKMKGNTVGEIVHLEKEKSSGSIEGVSSSKPPGKKEQLGTGAEVVSSLSKQARKRKQKRLREEQNRESGRTGTAKSDGTVRTENKLGRNKSMERKDIPPKKNPKHFNDKQNTSDSKFSKVGMSPPVSKAAVSGGSRLLLVGDERSKNFPQDGKKKQSLKKKIEVKTTATGEETVHTGEEEVTVHSGHQKDTPDVDRNWLNLMKTIEHKPHKKKVKRTSGKAPDKTDMSPKVWFDDVDPLLLAQPGTEATLENTSQIDDDDKTAQIHTAEGLTKYIALDCEMVGIGSGGQASMLARVSMVNQQGTCIYDKYVAAQEDVTNFRTSVSGIRPANLENAENFTKVQEEVSAVLKGRILVGHALHNDLKVLFLKHPKSMMRDTSTYGPFRQLCQGQRPSLKKLCEMILKIKIQEGEHNSVEDAQAVMNLFMKYRKKWEKGAQKMTIKRKRGKADAMAGDSL